MVDWVETIGPVIVGSLAEKCSVTLSQNLITFLNKFGDKVETASKSLRSKTRRSLKAMAELNSVNTYVEEEVERLRTTILGGRLDNQQYFYVESHAETYLPVVHLHLKYLPEIIVHVYRSYGVRKKGISFGFRLRDFCEGRLTGKLAQSANYLREKCRSADWQLSVTEVLQLWIQRAKNIPPSERGPRIQRHYITNNLPIETPQSRDKQMISRKRTPSPEPSQRTHEPFFDEDDFGTPQVMPRLRKTERRTSFRVTDTEDILDVDHGNNPVEKPDQNADKIQYNDSSNAAETVKRESKLSSLSVRNHDKSEQNDEKISAMSLPGNDSQDQSHLDSVSNEQYTDRMSHNMKRSRNQTETVDRSIEEPVTPSKRKKSIDVDTSFSLMNEASETPLNAADCDMNPADEMIELAGDNLETRRSSKRFKIVDEDGEFTSDVEKDLENEDRESSQDSQENISSEAPATVRKRFRIVDDEVEPTTEAENLQEDTGLADHHNDLHDEVAHELEVHNNQESLPTAEVRSKADSNGFEAQSETSKDMEPHVDSNLSHDHSSVEPEPTLSNQEKSTVSSTRRYQIVDDDDHVTPEGDKGQIPQDTDSTGDHPVNNSKEQGTANADDNPSDLGDKDLKRLNKEVSSDHVNTTAAEGSSEENQVVVREMKGNDEDKTTPNEHSDENKLTEEDGIMDEGTGKITEEKEVAAALNEEKSTHSRQDIDDDIIPVVDITKTENRGRDFTGSSNFSVVHDEFCTFESEADRRDAESDIDLNIDENI